MYILDQNTLALQIREKSRALAPDLVEIRRDLHRHPELSNREFRTAEKVAARLGRLGIPCQTGIAKTGVVALLEGEQPGPTVAVRADMDALPIEETLEVPYKSVHAGVKHACGHDAHTAMVLGVANVCASLRAQIRGRIKFIFQPAEEGAPAGETGGAYLMRDEGVLKEPDVDAIFGIHVSPLLELGQVGYHTGAAWASNDGLEIVIHGKKTHGAYPHTGVDAIAVAAQVQLALETLVNRSVDVQNPLLISFGIVEGGNQFNVIADRVRLAGMFRTLDPVLRAAAPARIEQVVKGVTEAFGAGYSLSLQPGAPVTMNHPELVTMAVPVLEEAAGRENVVLLKPQMGAEDFAVFAELAPAFYFMVGVRNQEKGITGMLHTPEFDLDEDALPLGVEAMTRLVFRYLE
jgi:amidohydrolase